MKPLIALNMRYLFIIFIALMVLTSVSCSKNSSAPEEPLALFLTSGSWSITSFIHDSADVKNDFEGYSFVFDNAGKVMATNQGSTAQGSWSIKYINTNQGPASNTRYLILNFASPDKYTKLTRNWEPFGMSESLIDLDFSTPGFSLTLSKN